MQYEFGSGILWAIPSISLAGVDVSANPTPVPFGALQDVSIDMSGTVKELFGLKKFPLAVALGTMKVTGKAKAARITAALFNQLFGVTPAAGEIKVNYEEAGIAAANNVTVANNATWSLDLGVSYYNGVPLVRAANAPPVGSYSCANGVYTFNATDANAANDAAHAMKISYAYTKNTAPGQVMTITNSLLGQAPFFKVVLNQQFQGKHLTLTLNRCVASKLTFATKLEDWLIPEFDFSASCDDSEILGTISIAE